MNVLSRSQGPRQLAIAVWLACSSVFACSAREPATAPVDTSLNGAWTTRSSGIAALLNLVWTRDSVTGSGTYMTLQNMLGCGGSTLTGSGRVTFRASRSGAALTGVMAFDNGWTPAYTGTLEDNSRIAGAFHSVDAGSCSFGLVFGLVP